MLTLFWLVFWSGLTALAFAAGVSLKGRLRRRSHDVPSIDDDAIQSILSTGRLVVDDEPLDLVEIEEEEERFWSESWDEPEEW